ncbi:type II toxin-antitoxin system VapC family toxin [bacterium]|jgi:predicted nucleic acid-binding protein|nr:type II toxin-antitoxin system VapC family toxin [bacterium]NBX98351.1 type II toxin-antitoxin system VapC family toxin [bacterium]NDC93745.1 type II toxin-antitoxin system VapC family toxin [bacterium]NDD82886.1 type II toxin-antitoxin system VapC family toxin [bacterium]NDG28681.1 type II toxin-antitoxin system VapC family toxin [bacterium]
MIAVDTNIISAMLRGEDCVLPNDELYIPYVVLAELMAGVSAGNNPRKNKPLLDSFLHDTNVTTSPGLTPELLPFYTEIYGYLRAKGTPISPNDLWIAAECMYLSMSLLTRDNDFKSVPQIILIEKD